MSCGAQQGVSQNQSSSSGVHGAELGASAVEALPAEVSDDGAQAAGAQHARRTLVSSLPGSPAREGGTRDEVGDGCPAARSKV